MPVTPGQVVQSVRGAASVVGALKRLKAIHDETPELIRAALRSAASPDNPDEHHARKFAEDVEGRMWEKDPAAADSSTLQKLEHWG